MASKDNNELQNMLVICEEVVLYAFLGQSAHVLALIQVIALVASSLLLPELGLALHKRMSQTS